MATRRRRRAVPVVSITLPQAVATAARKSGPKRRVHKLSHLVADALRTRIGNGDLGPGDGLPSESELLRQFGVSRPTLREGLRVVESEGLIALGRGARSGARVLGPSIEAAARYGEMYLAAQKTALGAVHQVRTMLEPAWVELLATRPRPELVAALRACVAAERAAIAANDLIKAVSALNEFHRRMVDFSENRALSLFAGILEGIPNNVYQDFLQRANPAMRRAFGRRTAQSVEAHAKLVDLIAAGKPAKAGTFWRSYNEATATFLERTGLAELRVKMPVSLL